MAEKIQIIEENVFKQLEKLDKELEKVLETLKLIVKEGSKITFDMKGAKTIEDFSEATERASTNTSKLSTEQKELLKIQRQIEIQEARLSTAYVEEVKRLQEAKDKVKEFNREQQDFNKITEKGADTLNKLIKRNKELRREMGDFSIYTKEGRAQMAIYRDEIDRNTEAIRENTDADRKRMMTIGEYRQEVKAAVGDMGLFGVSINSIGESLNKAGEMSKLFGKSVKMALLSTGIGALVVAFGALYSYFTKTISGSEKLRVGMAGIKQVGIELQNSFSKLGEKIANIDWVGTLETAKKYIPFAREISAIWNTSRDALEKLNPELKKHRLEVEANVKAAQDLEKLNIAYEKVNMQVEQDIANLENKKALQEIIADDNTRDFATRQAAAVETIKIENEINDLKIANAQAQLAIAVEQSRLSGNNNIEQIKRVNELKIAVTEAETQKTIAVENAAKMQREIERDLFEQKLDNVLDVYDRNKTVIEQQLQDEKLSITERKKLRTELIEADIRNQKEIEKLYLEQTNKKIVLNELLKIDNVETLNDILQNELKFDEIERNRIREVYMERRQYIQDISKLRKEADNIDLISSKTISDANKEIIQKETDELVKQFQARVAKQVENIEQTRKLTADEIDEKIKKIREEGEAINETWAVIGEARLNNLEIERQRELKIAGDNKEKQQKINEKYDKEEAKVKRKQAIREKAMAIFELGLLLAGQIARQQWLKVALTTAQIVAVAAKKIPEFAKGVIDFKGGEAIVGEKGREILLDRTGKAYLSPDQATLTNLPAGASVIPNNETERILSQLPIHQQRVKEFRPRENALILELLKSNKRLENVIKRKKFVGININEKGFSSFMQQENSKTNIYSSYFRSKNNE